MNNLTQTTPNSPRMECDRIFQKTGLTIGEVAGTAKNKVFGIDLYNTPKGDNRYRIPGSAEVKKPRMNFADIEAKSKKWVPPPN